MDTNKLLEERGKTHGEYSEHARCTQTIMRALMAERNWSDLPDIMKESLHMIAHKMGRVVTGNPYVHDHWDDTSGYAVLVSQRIDALLEARRPRDTETEQMRAHVARTEHPAPHGYDEEAETGHVRQPIQATWTEYNAIAETSVRTGSLVGKLWKELYHPEQVKATGRFVMRAEYQREYGK